MEIDSALINCRLLSRSTTSVSYLDPFRHIAYPHSNA